MKYRSRQDMSNSIHFGVCARDVLTWTSRYDMRMAMVMMMVDHLHGPFLLFSPPFLYNSTHASTHARVRRFDKERAFLVSPNLQCMCSQLQNHCAQAPFVGAFTDITYCHCAYPWLPAYLGLPLCRPSLTGSARTSYHFSAIISIANDSSRHGGCRLATDIQTDRWTGRHRPNRHPHRHLPSIKNPHSTRYSTDRYDGMRWDGMMR
jgi:hypothetical protein